MAGAQKAKQPVKRAAGPQRGDKTAQDRKALSEAAEAEQREAAQRMSTATAQAQAVPNDVVDYTGEGVSDDELEAAGAERVTEVDPKVELPQHEVEEIDDLTGPEGGVSAPPVEEEAEVRPQTTKLAKRSEVVRPIDDCQFVFGTSDVKYTFTAGRAAKVPFEVAQHMREKGLVHL